jgi:predicted YcjX-like family ATPase
MTKTYYINPYARTRRIGVIGFGQSGKTTLLTSLISHLQFHNPKKFALEGNKDIIRCTRLTCQPEGAFETEFNYGYHRKRLTNYGQWPDRSTDCSKYVMSFGLNGHRLTHYHLTLYDVPGERAADVSMLKNDYKQWSSLQITHLTAVMGCTGIQAQTKQTIQQFLDIADNPTTNEPADSIIAKYKEALYHVYNEYGQFLTPSSFALDKAGRRLEDVVKNQLDTAAKCAYAVGKMKTGYVNAQEVNKEFAPLGDMWFKGNNPVGKQFSGNFQDYRKNVVKPVFQPLSYCTGLIILADIARILQVGLSAHNDYLNWIAHLLQALSPETGLLTSSMSNVAKAFALRRVAFVTTQNDRFHPDDHDCLKMLNEELIYGVRKQQLITEDNSKVFTCASIKTTAPTADPQVLCQLPGNTPVPAYRLDTSPFANGEFPDNDWENEAIHIHSTVPNFPGNIQAVPPQEGLDKVFDYVMNW